MLQQWWLDRMATSTSPLQEKLTLFWHGHFATANYKVTDMLLMYQQNALFRANATGQLPRSRAPDVVAARDADLARQRPERRRAARTRTSPGSSWSCSRSASTSTARTTSWPRPARGPGTTRSTATARQYHFYPEPSRRRHEDVHGRHPGLGRPRHHRLHPRYRRDAQADRRAVHRHEDVDVLRVPESRGRRSSTDLANAFLANDLSIHDLVRAIFMHPNFVSPQAMNGLVRSPAEWVAACMRVTGPHRRGREPAVVHGRHGPAAVRAAERLGLATERILAHDLAAVGTRELGAQPHRGSTTAVQNLLSDIAGMTVRRRGAARLRLVRHRQPVGAHALEARGVAHEATRRQQGVGQLDVHQPDDPADAQPGIQPRLGARS